MKKVENISTKDLKINWNKPQWLVSNTEPDIIVLSTGQWDGEDAFQGTALPCSKYPSGGYSSNWARVCFSVLDKDVPFIISNND